MTDADLDHCYTVLCQSLADVGQPRAELLLSMLSLSLMARCDDAAQVLTLIARAAEKSAING